MRSGRAGCQPSERSQVCVQHALRWPQVLGALQDSKGMDLGSPFFILPFLSSQDSVGQRFSQNHLEDLKNTNGSTTLLESLFPSVGGRPQAAAFCEGAPVIHSKVRCLWPPSCGLRLVGGRRGLEWPCLLTLGLLCRRTSALLLRC